MQINIGERIKELRKRDGRKQEDLAKALGVTPQAISRWEANGGYPDLGMIPSIANFFHITIDELFGYHNDRELIIQELNDRAQVMLNTQVTRNNDGDMTECIAFLRKGLAEFPDEPSLKNKLACALNLQGYRDKDGNPAEYWKEAADLYEELLEYEHFNILPLISIYSGLGEYKKAERKASEQPSVEISREVLLGHLGATGSIRDADKSRQYKGEAILSLLHALRESIDEMIATDEELKNSREGIDILQAVHHLYEQIVGEDCYEYHSDFCFLDLSCVKIAGNIGDYDAALQYYDSAYGHYLRFTDWSKGRYKKWAEQIGETDKALPANDHFHTKILRDVSSSTLKVYQCEPALFENAVSAFPEEVKKLLMDDPKYAELYDS